jgi:hypothetical protein
MKTKKIISFSLWGDNPLYTNGAIWNAQHSKEFYPDWICKFYYDETVLKNIIEKIGETGAELKLMNKTTDVLGAHWRFHAMFDDCNIERFIVRDTDSKFSIREVKMVDEWIKSELPFHIIRDCKQHESTIMAGMWGAIPGCVPEFEQKLGWWFSQLEPDYENPRGIFHGYDQSFLNKLVWPSIKNNHIAHVLKDLPHLKYTGNEIEVDEPEDGHYVGMVV